MWILGVSIAVAVLWFLLRSRPERAPRPGDAAPDADGGDVVDDLVLHDEANPGDDGDVGDTTDGR